MLSIPPCCLFIGMAHLKKPRLIEGRADDLHSNRQSLGRKTAAQTHRRQPGNVEGNRTQGAGRAAFVLQLNAPAVDDGETLAAFLDGLRRRPHRRRHQDIYFVERRFEGLADQPPHPLCRHIDIGRNQQ